MGRLARLDASSPLGCGAIDSFFVANGWPHPVEMSGRVTIDVNQYRVRGRFLLRTDVDDGVTFDFTSSVVLGAHREDAVFTMYGDTIQVLDRERERFHTGDAVIEMVARELGERWDLVRLIRGVLARPPGCGSLSEVGLEVAEDAARLAGRSDGHPFAVTAEGGRIVRAEWPLPGPDPGDGRLVIETEWGGGSTAPPTRVTASVPERRWRFQLRLDD